MCSPTTFYGTERKWADVSAFRIRFVLHPFQKIAPWGTPPNENLHWFGLSQGDYCIETDGIRLLEYRDPASGRPQWCDYYVVRLLEDLADTAPNVLERVPVDVAVRHLAWVDTGGADEPPADDALLEPWYEAQAWWGYRKLDFGYLSAAPQLHFWRVGDVVHLRWRARPGFDLTVERVDQTMTAMAFAEEVQFFARSFVEAMGKRTRMIASSGWPGAPCAIDVVALHQEQTMRERPPVIDFRRKQETDWDAVRRHLDRLGF